MVTVKNIKKSFGTQQVLNDVSLTIENGETVAIVGPSGTGKSVLLKIISGLLTADSGDIVIDQQIITTTTDERTRQAVCEKMGILFQAAALFDSMTLLENIAFPLRFGRSNYSEEEIIERSLLGLKEVGLKGQEMSLPGEVSIGMRKRVGIARALVTEPAVILFDEPNTGLDPQTGQEIYDLIADTQARRKFAGVVISHEIPEVFQICNRVAMLFDGKIQEEGSIDKFYSSSNPAVQQFIRGDTDGPIRMM
jgi:phospholipid/cholesterol/gamma-HCH transport system ATP-binding protein